MATVPEQTRKPANTAFKQQRLKAWQPILTPKTVIPTYFVIGLIFIPIGIGLFIASNRVNQVVMDYTNCNTTQNQISPPVISMVYLPESATCRITWVQDQDFAPPVFLYYRLTNFYQNHRRYVKSFDPNQLQGQPIQNQNQLSSNCAPLQAPNANAPPQYYPCGLIANSMFSDDIGQPYQGGSNATGSLSALYYFTEKGIAWPSDASKFGTSQWFTNYNAATPPTSVGGSQWITQNLIVPPAWKSGFAWKGWANGYDVTKPDGYPRLGEWERFQVWMRTAGLPTFRKLWGRNDTATMPAGTWTIDVGFHFDVARFGGTKALVISTISVIGGKNPFLGIAYMVVGGLAWLLGLIFLARQMIKPRKLGDHTYLSWNQPHPGAAANGAPLMSSTYASQPVQAQVQIQSLSSS